MQSRKMEMVNVKDEMHFQLNEPDVIQETVEGETLIIHTTTGAYFVLGGTGVPIWNALLAGHSINEIENSFKSDSDEENCQICSSISDFVRGLWDEQLIRPIPNDPTLVKASPSSLNSLRAPFTTPEFRKFTDMQELLLVDPIHEVSPDAGWPFALDSPQSNA